MPTTPEAVFHYEVQKSGDENTCAVTTITCHGRLVRETSGQIKQIVKPLIPMGHRIVLDLTVKEGFCRLELFNPSPRERKPGRLSSLTQLFSS
jgi:hypothetical protein